METSNLPDIEFKTLVIRMLNDLRGREEEQSENFGKEIVKTNMKTENIKKKSVRNEEFTN